MKTKSKIKYNWHSLLILCILEMNFAQGLQAQNSNVEKTDQAMDSVIFNSKTEVQTWQSPAETSVLHIDACGAQGGGENGGKGGRVQSDLNITPGSKLYIYAGIRPTAIEGGFNGGGNGCGKGFGGGGASDIRMGGTALENRILVAGGGGGTGYGGSGGDGGGLEGGSGYSWDKNEHHNAMGGTQDTGGKGARAYFSFSGKLGIGGDGINSRGSCTNDNMAGGGGGYYGGGGSGAGGAGGGSSFTNNACKNVIHKQGANEGNGRIKIYWKKPKK